MIVLEYKLKFSKSQLLAILGSAFLLWAKREMWDIVLDRKLSEQQLDIRDSTKRQVGVAY